MMTSVHSDLENIVEKELDGYEVHKDFKFKKRIRGLNVEGDIDVLAILRNYGGRIIDVKIYEMKSHHSRLNYELAKQQLDKELFFIRNSEVEYHNKPYELRYVSQKTRLLYKKGVI